jgi:hypothetical protein
MDLTSLLDLETRKRSIQSRRNYAIAGFFACHFYKAELTFGATLFYGKIRGEMGARTTPAIPVAGRIGGFVYAIRNIVTEARNVEAT